MKKLTLGLIGLLVVVGLIGFVVVSKRSVSAQPAVTAPRAAEKQVNLQNVPDLPYDAQVVVDNLKMPPELALGEAAGVDTDSKGNIYVYSRTGDSGDIRYRRSAQLFEFGPDGKFMREIGARNNYIMGWAHSVRIDKDDNIWIVDNGTNLVAKFNQRGQQLLALGRRNESVQVWGLAPKSGELVPIPGMDAPGGFGEPTDVAFDAQGNSFVSDGYKNSQVQKFDKDGHFVKRWGTKGGGPGQFNNPHGIATDAQGNVYVADRGNNRVQVFDNNGNFQRLFETNTEKLYAKSYLSPTPPLGGGGTSPDAYYNSGLPNSLCVSPGPNPVLYANALMPGSIWKFSLDGKPLGKVVSAGRKVGQFAWLHEMACSRTNPNEVYVTEMVNYRVQKVTFHPEKMSSNR